jgi:hypothetical protein
MGKLIHIFFGALMTASALAQTETIPDANIPTPANPATKKEKPDLKVTAPISTLPSRNVGAAEMDSYVASIASAFLIQKQERDAFGQSQDPDAKPVIKVAPEQKLRRITPVLAIQFSEIIQKIVVTTIMPGEQRFLVGTRSIKRGDQFPLIFRGKQILVLVTEVTSQKISFRNLETGEIASRKLDMLPAGMTPGLHGITAPGMISDRANAPIELESDESTPGNSNFGNTTSSNSAP